MWYSISQITISEKYVKHNFNLVIITKIPTDVIEEYLEKIADEINSLFSIDLKDIVDGYDKHADFLKFDNGKMVIITKPYNRHRENIVAIEDWCYNFTELLENLLSL